MRAVEIGPTAAIVQELLAEDAGPGGATETRPAASHGVGCVEGPRGETTCVVELREGRVARLRLRTGSYANWAGVAHAATGEILPDFPLVNKSFELCYACADR
jgi:Ni,Fe-hydrogenase III large subunit